MATIIDFPDAKTRYEKEIDEIFESAAIPNGVDPEKWKTVALPEIRECLKTPTINKSFNMGSMTQEEADKFQAELVEFLREYTEEVVHPLVLRIAKLYGHILKDS